MPSPFPGMDPYLERHWGDVRTSLVTYARDRLQALLPRNLRARVEERVVVSLFDRPRSLFPDVRVIETERSSRREAKRAGSIAVAQPLVIELADEPETQRFLEIREVSSDSRLVTVLEVLSPSNYQNGGYDDIDYTQSPQPPLPPAAARWAAQLLRDAGRRRARKPKRS